VYQQQVAGAVAAWVLGGAGWAASINSRVFDHPRAQEIFLMRCRARRAAPALMLSAALAAITNPAVQNCFNATAPVWGVLYEPMLLKDGATVEATFGARAPFEADLLVRVSDALITTAKTPGQVLQSIEQLIPAIELPDLVVEAPSKLNVAGVAAINVGARYFVAGTPIAVKRTQAFAESLASMKVLVMGGGLDLDTGFGRDVLDHPFNALAWLAQDLQKRGLALKKGDLISVGSFAKLMPSKAGQKVEVQYQGLPDNPTVSVKTLFG
jgi:2-keto-4-pentenoate hydratase